MSLAFSGLRVIDFTQVLAGPFATQQLALQGADVIKIELPGTGDMTRALLVGGNSEGDSAPGMTASFMTCNQGKRSIVLDLKTDAGRKVAEALIATADAVVENFKPGTMERLGLGYDRVRRIKPDIVYCSVSGYGQSGPKASLPAFDGAIQASSGMMSITGHAESGPTRTGFFAVDMSTALHAAFAISAALFRRQQTGAGQHLDVTMLDTALMMQAPQVASTALTGRTPQLNGNSSPTREPTANVFPCANGYVQISALKQKQMAALLSALGLDAWAQDPRFADAKSRKAHSEEIRGALAEVLSQSPAAHWLKVLNDAGVPCSQITSLDQVMEEPALAGRPLLQALPHPKRDGQTRVVGPGHMANADGPVPGRPPPRLGEHTEEVLAELGYSAAEVQRLRDAAVI